MKEDGENGRDAGSEKPQRAMRSEAAGRVYGRHSGYRRLRVYQLAELLYDFTCRFCERYVPRRDRHHDQMVQAARSGYQNLAEGSEDSATSKKLEMNLTNVARASLGELEKDFVKHLQRRGLLRWQQGEALFEEARALRPANLAVAVAWVNGPRAGGESREERAANLGAILSAQAHWLAERLLDRQARDFEAGGGFSERLHKARREERGKRTDGRDKRDRRDS